MRGLTGLDGGDEWRGRDDGGGGKEGKKGMKGRRDRGEGDERWDLFV